MFEPEFTARGVESRRRRWHQRIAEGAGPILVADLDHRPLALSFSVPAEPPLSGFAEIYSFYGHPDGWGSGVAVALMGETLRVLGAEGYSLVHLWTLKATAQSRRFYDKCGFHESGAERKYDFGDGQLFDQVEYRRAVEGL